MEPILLIMAAGMGSRYGGAKQIDPVTAEGDIIMDFSLYDAYRAGFRRAVFVIKPDFEEVFRAHIARGASRMLETRLVCQRLSDLPDGYSVPPGRVKPWGTGHAVLAAREAIDAPFAVINADDYYGPEAFRVMYDFLAARADASHDCMVGFELDNTLSENGTVARGICTVKDGILSGVEEHLEVGKDENGIITGINLSGERHELPSKAPVSMNMWGFGAEFVGVLGRKFEAALQEILKENPMKGEFYLPSSVNEEIRDGNCEVQVLRSGDKWFGVTYKEDRATVLEQFAQMKENGKYPRHLWDEE